MICIEALFGGLTVIACPVAHSNDGFDGGFTEMHSCQQGLMWSDLTPDMATAKRLLAEKCECQNSYYGCWETAEWRNLQVSLEA